MFTHTTAMFGGSHIPSGLFPIEQEIVEALRSSGQQAYREEWSTDSWTRKAINDQLLSLADQHGFACFSKGLVGEWLFDLVWVDTKPDASGQGYDWTQTRGLALACESEWKNGDEQELLWDFFKLTFAVANLRLFIYTNAPLGDGKHPVDRCKQVCPLSRGFRYLTIGFPLDGKSGEFRVDAWTA